LNIPPFLDNLYPTTKSKDLLEKCHIKRGFTQPLLFRFGFFDPISLFF